MHELGQFHNDAKGLAEGFMDGNVEIIHLEDEIGVVIYHFSQPKILPVTMPLGYMTKDKELVKKLGILINTYVKDSSAFDKPNDCGAISSLAKGVNA